MLTCEARIATDRASRYLTQLGRHAGQMRRHRGHRPRTRGSHGDVDTPPTVERAEWSDTHGVITFAWGQCTLRATDDALIVRAEAADAERLRRIQDGITRRLETIGRRDRLTVGWDAPETSPDHPGEATDTAPVAEPPPRSGRGMTIGLAALGVLLVAAHLGLFGAALVSSRWTSWGTNVIVALVLIKVLILGGHALGVRSLGRFAQRRGPGSHHAPHHGGTFRHPENHHPDFPAE